MGFILVQFIEKDIGSPEQNNFFKKTLINILTKFV